MTHPPLEPFRKFIRFVPSPVPYMSVFFYMKFSISFCLDPDRFRLWMWSTPSRHLVCRRTAGSGILHCETTSSLSSLSFYLKSFFSSAQISELWSLSLFSVSRSFATQALSIPDICNFFYTYTFSGLKILHSKVRKFTLVFKIKWFL